MLNYNINVSSIQLYISFKMFMTCMMRYVILAKMKTNQFKSVSSKTTYFSIKGGGGGGLLNREATGEGGMVNKYLHLKWAAY